MAEQTTTRRRRAIRGALAKRIAGAALIAALASPAPAAQAKRVVIVRSGDAAPYRQTQAELKIRLASRKHEARSIALRQFARDPDLAAAGADAFIAIGTKAAVWLNAHLPPKARLTYCMVSDPNGAGLTKGDRACGVSINVPLAAQFALVARALPKARSLGLLYRGKTPKGKALVKQVKNALPKGWRLEAVAVEKYASTAKAIEGLLARDIDVVWTCPDAAIYNVATVRSLLLTAIRQKTPVFGFSPALVRAGALVGVGIDPRAQAAQAAEITHRLLAGKTAHPQSRPAARRPAPEFQIAVNLIVARKLSIALPKELVKTANYVFGGKEGKRE